MNRRQSLVGDEVVAAEVAEQAEKKRNADEQRALARSKRRRGGSGHGRAKAGTQGSEKEAEERRVKTEKLPLFDKENLNYDGEQAERRTVFRWFLRAHGKTERKDWLGQYGMSVEVCSRMGLPSSCAENARDVWADHEAGVDVRAPPNRKRALKLSAGDRAVARDCLASVSGRPRCTSRHTGSRSSRRRWSRGCAK
jgi:hypothetical protein